MHLIASHAVGREQRTNQKHRGAGCAHEVCENRARQKKCCVELRFADKRSLQMNTARNNVERAHKDNKGNVIAEQCVR